MVEALVTEGCPKNEAFPVPVCRWMHGMPAAFSAVPSPVAGSSPASAARSAPCAGAQSPENKFTAGSH